MKMQVTYEKTQGTDTVPVVLAAQLSSSLGSVSMSISSTAARKCHETDVVRQR